MPDDTTPETPEPAASGLSDTPPAIVEDSGKAGRGRHAAPSRFKKTWAVVIGVVVLLLAGAGFALAMTGAKKKATTSAPVAVVATTTTLPPEPCPLTGAPGPTATVPARPAVAVKIDNVPQARPQTGIDLADIVFEEPVEGNLTRLVAVFQCQTPPLVGDIRSARAPDVPISDLLSRPLFIHAGGINPVIGLLQSANLVDDNLFTHSSLEQNPPGRYAPFDTFTSPAAVWALNPGATTPPAPVFTYSPAPVGGTPAAAVHIAFSSTNDTTWTWNPANSLWALSYSGVPATVVGGNPIDTTNVVVMKVPVTYGPWVENSGGGLEVQAQMTGSGPVTVMRNGQQITGTWNRPALGAPMTLTSATGAVIALAPGQTWVEVVPNAVPVTVAP
jgi:hypothetical protein